MPRLGPRAKSWPVSDLPSPGPDGSALCASCGLCCDGTLYTQARAEKDEMERMTAFGLELFEAKGGDRFRQPCPALDGACCTIYEQRFAICRSFRCALLRRFQAGEVPLDEALRSVATAHEMLDRLEARAPGNRTLRARRQLAAEARKAMTEPGEGRAEAGQAYVELVALERFLDTRFRNPRDEQAEPG